MPTFNIEQKILDETNIKGSFLIAGGDEVGRGCLAGPVTVALVILDPNNIDKRINDSKKLSTKIREELYETIINTAIGYSISSINAKEIDKINILQATRKAMYQASKKINPTPHFLLLDALEIKEINIPQKKIIKGDNLSYSIAAASILAKVHRDKLMSKYDIKYPGYDFKKNKGYGSPKHLAAIKEMGATPIHRLSFKPIKQDDQSQLTFNI